MRQLFQTQMAIPFNSSDSFVVTIWVWFVYEPEKEIIRTGDFVETKNMVLRN
jgi:hypothetical protein